ncbi:MAG: SoxXA-binding protein [Gammaproteobacteria bacterium]|jgi:hypothetical protein
MKKLAIAITTLFILSGCSLFGGGDGGSMDSSGGGSPEVQAMIKEAEAAIEKARKADGEWRDSVKKYLKKAKAAAAKGDNDKAMKLAKQAKFEGEMGYQQAVDQKNAGPWLF